MAHGHRRCAYKALMSSHQQSAFNRATSRVRTVQHPHLFAGLCRLFQQVKQRGYKGVDSAAQVLQIEQEDIGRRHHLRGGTAHFAIKAENRDTVMRIDLVRSFDHIVLLIAFEPMLRAKSSGYIHARFNQSIERVSQICCHAGGVRDQRNTLAFQWFAQFRFCQQTINSKFHRHYRLSKRNCRHTSL